MSTDEINSQVGKALKEYSEAKVAYAHSEDLLGDVAGEYEVAARVLRVSTGERFTSADSVIQQMNPLLAGATPRLTMVDGARLIEYLREHQKAMERVKAAYTTLSKLGFGNIS